MGLTAHRRAAKRLTTGGATLTRRAAQWAARNRLTAAGTAIIGAPAALNLWHTQRWTAPAAAAAITWAAWRAGRTPTAPTSENTKQKGPPESGGVADKTDIETVNGIATMTPDPRQDNRTIVSFRQD